MTAIYPNSYVCISTGGSSESSDPCFYDQTGTYYDFKYTVDLFGLTGTLRAFFPPMAKATS
jgi:hypothetical protein